MDRKWIKLNLRYGKISLGSRKECWGRTATQMKILNDDSACDEDDTEYIDLSDEDLDRLIDALVKIRNINKGV